MTLNDVRRRTFEHDKVKMLLAGFNFTDKKYKQYLAELREAGRREGSDGYLTFSSLVATEQFHNCPVRLHAHSVGGEVGRVSLPYLMKFEKSYFYNRYCVEWENRDPHDTRPFGLITNMPSVQGGIIIHDADLPGITCLTAVVHRSLSKYEPPMVTLEPYKAFVQRLVKHWGIDSDDGLPTTKPRDAIQSRFERWMVQQLGSGPAIVVLAWLHGAWHDPHKRYCVRQAGVSCLCVTQSLIAQETGLSEDSVKNAFETLKREEQIHTKRGDRRTYLTVAGLGEEWPDESE